VEHLGAQTGEIVNLEALDDFRTVSIHPVGSAYLLRIHMRIGEVSAHATGTGKILLATVESAELSRRLAGRRLEAITPTRIKGRPARIKELAREEKGVGR
jgi:DNA-binding IclR family transcriptional regulator